MAAINTKDKKFDFLGISSCYDLPVSRCFQSSTVVRRLSRAVRLLLVLVVLLFLLIGDSLRAVGPLPLLFLVLVLKVKQKLAELFGKILQLQLEVQDELTHLGDHGVDWLEGAGHVFVVRLVLLDLPAFALGLFSLLPFSADTGRR